MLINSVILFLRDALPALLFIGILAAVIDRNNQTIHWLSRACAAGFAFMLLISQIINPLSDLADGFGFELFTAIMHLIAYVSTVVFLLISPPKRILPASIATALLIGVYGTNLQIYFHGFWSDPGVLDALLVGSALGFGICLSLAILTFYGLRSSVFDRWPQLPQFVLSLAAARQITESVYFLIQADWLPSTHPLWNTSRFVSDSSEFGHLLNALTGYESSPSAIQVVVHLIALTIPILIILKKRSPNLTVTEAQS